MKLTDVRQQFSELISRVFKGQTRVMIEKSGIPVAALISARELERLNRLDAERDRDFAVLDEIGEALRGAPEEELEREAAKAIAQVRVEEVARPRRDRGVAAKRTGRRGGRARAARA